MKIHSTLEILNSKRNKYGNCEWAFRFTDHETGKVAQGKISGNDSNIYAVRMGWSKKSEWDRGINVIREELMIRDFRTLTKDWEYAGCTPDDLRAWIREKLAE